MQISGAVAPIQYTAPDGSAVEVTNATPLPVAGGDISAYALNNFENGTTLYLGKVKSDGTWLLQKYDQGTGVMRYANESNNAGVTTYASAWSGKSGLTYNEFQVLTGV